MTWAETRESPSFYLCLFPRSLPDPLTADMASLAGRGVARVAGARALSTSLGARAEDKYPPLEHAKHFPVRTDTMLPPGAFSDRVRDLSPTIWYIHLKLPLVHFSPVIYLTTHLTTHLPQVVLVTGGGTGLGKGMALKFSHLGAKVTWCNPTITLHLTSLHPTPK